MKYLVRSARVVYENSSCRLVGDLRRRVAKQEEYNFSSNLNYQIFDVQFDLSNSTLILPLCKILRVAKGSGMRESM